MASLQNAFFFPVETRTVESDFVVGQNVPDAKSTSGNPALYFKVNKTH